MGNSQQQSTVGNGSIFDYTVETIAAPETVELKKYKGKKAYIVVNVACQCGLTNSNYKALQEVYDKYSPDLEILAFPWYNNFSPTIPHTHTVHPSLTYYRLAFSHTHQLLIQPSSNNFGAQEPGTNEEVQKFATEKKQATFPIFGKLECENGDKTHPLYQMLRKGVDSGVMDTVFGQSLKWNFTKVCVVSSFPPVYSFCDDYLTDESMSELLTNNHTTSTITCSFFLSFLLFSFFVMRKVDQSSDTFLPPGPSVFLFHITLRSS